MHHGRAVSQGTPAELSAGSGRPVLRFGAPPGLDLAALSAAVGGAVSEESPGRYRADVAPPPAVTPALATFLAEHQAALTDLSTGRSLEEAYLSIVGEAGAHQSDPEPVTRRGRRARR